MRTLDKKGDLRARFLQTLYALSTASIHNEVPLEKIETEARIPPESTREVILYLSQKRLIELRIKNVCITTGGIYEVERVKRVSVLPNSPTQIVNYHTTNIQGPNYGGIQQGGQQNTQSIPAGPSTKQEPSHKQIDVESGINLYDQVMAMSADWETVDEVKAQLIIEYSNDAIEAFGKTNQNKKVELRRIIDKAENVISPDSIDTFKKRAEKSLLRFVYPKNTRIRNIILLLLGIIILLAFILPFIFRAWRSFYQTDNTSPSNSKQRVVLVLTDVTTSISPEQLQKSANLSADILDSLPVNSIYSVYPIQTEADRVLPIIPRQVVPEIKSKFTLVERDHVRNIVENRRVTLRMEMERLHRDGLGKQSCIINMLWFAQDQLLRMAETPVFDAKFDYELIIVSDMVDTCKGSPLTTLRLPPDLRRLRNGGEVQVAPDFSRVRITIIFPLASNRASNIPSDSAVKAFWRDIFRQCGLKDEWFWDQVHIDWIPNGQLPARLRPKQLAGIVTLGSSYVSANPRNRKCAVLTNRIPVESTPTSDNALTLQLIKHVCHS